MATKLSFQNLAALSAAASVPSYDRAALSSGIVHFGVGNFHRAHQAVYLDSLFNTGRDHDWAITGAGVLPTDETMRQTLAGQDFLTTVVEQSASGSTARITGAMIAFLPPDDLEAIIRKLADAAIRIVSMTITEGGYFIDPATGVFDAESPQIVSDGAHPATPRTVFGLIVAALKRRRLEGTEPFTVMSCDNVPHNGVVARNAVTGLARISDPELASWIGDRVAFPNAMVDGITPATSDREREILARDFGIDDRWPVFCEGFHQWVLEDHFSAGRPALERVGVQFVDDVTPYEHMKIRILNGGHAVVGYPAGLLDIQYAHEAMEHPTILRFLQKVEREEIIPVVPPVPDTDLAAYYRKVEQRFANPKIADTVQRLCLDGSNRQPNFIIPCIADRLADGASVTGLALESALWCRYCYGTTESGRTIEPNDANWSRLTSVARAAREDPTAWLGMEDIYGEIGRAETLRAEFVLALQALWSDGVEHTLGRYLEGEM